ncbi:MAG: hypothetical protein ACRDJF_05540, partial [Actinomycetota bacterium]
HRALWSALVGIWSAVATSENPSHLRFCSHWATWSAFPQIGDNNRSATTSGPTTLIGPGFSG